ncbi:hypothetical protein DM02DRAFT_562063, partial [Periconia macrospinosa]
MDSGPYQEAMVERLKSEVKEKATVRRTLGYILEAESTNNQPPDPERDGQSTDPVASREYIVSHHGSNPSSDQNQPEPYEPRAATPDAGGRYPDTRSNPLPAVQLAKDRKVFPGCDLGFKSFYLDYFFPFMFPFYQPHMLEGGRNWLFEFVDKADGMQQTTIALSSYLFSVVLDASEDGHGICKNIGWDKLLQEMEDSFARLSANILLLGQPANDVSTELALGIRTLGTIVQLQRFEIATLGFANCRKHLDAAVHCLKQIMGVDTVSAGHEAMNRFFTVMDLLGPSPWPRDYRKFQIVSPDQVGFRFFTSVLVADDIIASTALGEEPRLYDQHAGLMSEGIEGEWCVDLEVILGCQNWAMLEIGKISALAAWKKKSNARDDAHSELANRGDAIKASLQASLERLNSQSRASKVRTTSIGVQNLKIFQTWQQSPITPAAQSQIVTRIWAHSALIYLSITTNGWNPDDVEIRKNVAHVIELLDSELSPPALLRTVAWPFFVAGCLAQPSQVPFFRRQEGHLQPSGMFVTVRKAIEMMEVIWQKRA